MSISISPISAASIPVAAPRQQPEPAVAVSETTRSTNRTSQTPPSEGTREVMTTTGMLVDIYA